MAGFDRISITRATESIIISNVDKLYEYEFCFSTDTKKLFIKKNGVLSELTGLVPSDIINDLTTGGANKVASAETVKNLNQMITLTNSNVNNKLEKGGYTGGADDLKKDIDNNASKIEINKMDILLKRDKTDRVFENGLLVSQGQDLQFEDRVNNMFLNMYKGKIEGQDINSIYNYISTGGSAKMFDERNCPISKTPSGWWCKFANGLIVQWGIAGGTVDVAFPISFSYPPQVITSGAVVDTSPIYQTLSGCEVARTNNFKLVSYGFMILGETGSGINNSSYKAINGGVNFGGSTRWLAIGY